MKKNADIKFIWYVYIKNDTEVASLAQYQRKNVGDNEMAELNTFSENEL